MALTELARFLPRGAQHNRYLRSGLRPHHRDDSDHHRRGEVLAASASIAHAALAAAPIDAAATVPTLAPQAQLANAQPKEPLA
jgi:hypothetical protein